MKRLLEIPDRYAVAEVLSAGHRAEAFPTRLRRRPVEDFATRNRFGGQQLLG